MEVGRDYRLEVIRNDPSTRSFIQFLGDVFLHRHGVEATREEEYKIFIKTFKCTKSRTQLLREENEEMKERLKENEEKKKRQEEEQRLMEENASLKRKLEEVDEREGGSKAPKH
jgi:cell shape-determining protein MreC